jgi:hypothetical protein
VLKLDDLNDRQRRDREAVVDTLTQAGWDGTVNQQIVDQGMPFEFQASLEYDDNDAMSLMVQYDAGDPTIELTLDALEGEAVLSITPGNKLQELLDLIVAFQDEISANNFRVYVSKILDLAPDVYVDRGEDGMQKLVKDDDLSL